LAFFVQTPIMTMDIASFEPELDAAEAKKQRKAAKRAAAEAAELAPPAIEDAYADDDATAEAKKTRKAAKRAAAAEAKLLVEQVAEPDVAAAEAKKQRKAAKAAAKEAAAAAEADADRNAREELEAVEAKRARKLAKRAAAEALAKDSNNEEDKREPSMKKGKTDTVDEKTSRQGKAKGFGKGSKELEVVVLGLPPTTASSLVRRDFAECGEIVDFRMPLNDDGSNKGVAFIEYREAESCSEALTFYGKEYNGRRLVVRMALDAGGKDGKGKGKGGSKEFEVFVGGLPWNITEERVRKDFSECGEILAFRMPLTKSGLSQGIAFIEYADIESSDKALKFNGSDYGGRWLDVRMTSDAPPRKDKSEKAGGQGNNQLEVFVGGLHHTTTEHDLRESFAKCGEIAIVKMPTPRESDTRRIAFIEFKEKDACGKALKFSDTEMGGLRINVRMSGSSGKSKEGKSGKGKGKGKKGKK